VVFHSASAKGAPRFLQTVPKFFKTGRHEQRFVARAQEVRKTLPQRRLQRQEFVRTRSDAGGAKVAPKAGANRVAPKSGAPKAEARPHREMRAPEKAREARSPQNLRRPEHPQQLHKPAAKAHRPGEAKR
jgi:hypothetical protein